MTQPLSIRLLRAGLVVAASLCFGIAGARAQTATPERLL
jgi:hypothetical protein